jgi:hypothetical protein
MSSNDPVYDNYGSDSCEGSEVDNFELISVATTEYENELLDQLLMYYFPTTTNHKFSEIREPTTVILEHESTENMLQTFRYEDQIEVDMVAHYQLRYAPHVFEDPIAFHLHNFISANSFPLFYCEYEVQVNDELSFYFQFSTLLKHTQRIQLVSHMLEWMYWLFHIT